MIALIDTSALLLPFERKRVNEEKLHGYKILIPSYVEEEFRRVCDDKRMKNVDKLIQKYERIILEQGGESVDNALIRDAERLNALLITADTGLVKKAKKRGIQVVQYTNKGFKEE